MEFLILFTATVFLAPLVLSILALIRANRAMREIDSLKGSRGSNVLDEQTKAVSASERVSEALRVPMGSPTSTKMPPPLPPVSPHPSAPRAAPPVKQDIETALGGRVSSFVGAAALVISIAFFAGYAIQHGLLGPRMRLLVSGVSAIALLGLGQHFGRRDARYALQAQALTGAGAALLYFTVFAAHRLYHFMGFWGALTGLAVCAAGILWLAYRNNSQAVAAFGIIGAYVTPWLVETPSPIGLFPLVYVVFVNLPVIALYRWRPWHSLPNIAALLTVLHFFVSYSPRESAEPFLAAVSLGMAYIGLVGLSLVSMNRQRTIAIRDLDLIRLTLEAWAFGIQLARTFAVPATWEAAGVPLLVAGLSHAAVALWMARKSSPPEAVAFMHYASIFIGAAAYARFEGLMTYVLWGAVGIMLSAIPFARGKPSLRALALVFGLLGLAGVLMETPGHGLNQGRVFINARFATGLLLSLFIAMQGFFARRNATSRSYTIALYLTGVSFAISMTALELSRIKTDWAQAAVSTWLGVAAFASVGIGFMAGSRIVRYYGLAIFGIMVLKVFLVDLADLRGLERAAAFFVAGILLLVLSFVYQRLAAGRSRSGDHV
jgi:uncharacterized membrane protein